MNGYFFVCYYTTFESLFISGISEWAYLLSELLWTSPLQTSPLRASHIKHTYLIIKKASLFFFLSSVGHVS